MKTLALYSIKGGVGKTAAAVNLAYVAAEEGTRVILIDLDPQGSASYYFRVKSPERFKGKHLIKAGKKFIRSIKGTDYRNLDVLPSHFSYRNLDLLLGNHKRSTMRLQETLQKLESQYDFVVLDSPPNISLVSENIFCAADTLLIPVVPTTLSLLTYQQLLRFFADRGLNQSKIAAFFSMVEKRKNLHREIIEKLLLSDGRILKTLVPYSSFVEKMGIYREPVVRAHPKSIAAQSYRDLWMEVKAICARAQD